MSRASHPTQSAALVPGPGIPDSIPLSRVAVGWRRIVTSIEGPARGELACEGVLPGIALVVTARAPLGGPLIVDLGRARIALSAGVAAQVQTSSFERGAGTP
jgi:Fe2+ transport system protein FeoA